jgi:regulator of RNase E activity RraA
MARFKTSQVCLALGGHVRVLPASNNFTGIREFEGLAMPIVVHEGTRELNELLRSHTQDRVAIIDGSHFGRTAVFGRKEVTSAFTGGCRAVVVLGMVTEVAAIEMARIPVVAFGHTPKAPAPEIGTAHAGLIDSEVGLLTTEHYIVGDADGVVAVEQDTYQERFEIK